MKTSLGFVTALFTASLGGLLVTMLSLSAAETTTATTTKAPANPWFKPPLRASYEEGQFVYERNCVICHGRTGKGDGDLVQNWPIRPRNFTQAVFKYRSTPYGKLPSNADLERTIRQGVSGTPMPTFNTILRDSEIKAVIEYIKTFSPDWRNPDNFAGPITIPETPAWYMEPKDRAEHAAEGKKLFLATCLPCHGEKGDGNGPAFRGAFIIDKNGIVRSQIVNDLPLGRNMEELIRLVDALQFHEEHGEVCPANWKKGDKGMDATPAGVAKYLAENAAKL